MGIEVTCNNSVVEVQSFVCCKFAWLYIICDSLYEKGPLHAFNQFAERQFESRKKKKKFFLIFFFLQEATVHTK